MWDFYGIHTDLASLPGLFYVFNVTFLSRLLCWRMCVYVYACVHLRVHMCASVSGVSPSINEQIIHDSAGMCDAVG